MSITWNAKIRNETGQGASHRLKKGGYTPAIVYGDKKESISIALQTNILTKALIDSDIFNSPITLNIEEQEAVTVVIKDLQRHPAKNQVLHIDLQRINDNDYIVKKVPFNFIGSNQSPGVKIGALMTFLITDAQIKCKAKDLPTKIDVDVSTMEAGQNMRLSELKLPKGIILTALTHGNANYNQAIVKVSKPKK